MANVGRDFRFAIATLLRNPGTTSVVIATLALGIGANATIFSLLNAVVQRPLPIPHPEELVGLLTTSADIGNRDEPLTQPMFQELNRRQNALSALFASATGGLDNLEIDGVRFTVATANVSGDYYKAMQIAPVLGRFIAPSDVAMNSGTSNAVAVISYRLWRKRYHGDPNVVGKTLRLGVQPFTVIGVEPEGFSGLIIDGASDVTVPLFAPGSYGTRDPHQLWLDIRGRLRPGVTLAQAEARLQTLWPSIQRATVPPEYDGARSKRFFGRRLKVESASRGVSFLRRKFSSPLNILLVLVGSLLLIACLNLANLAIAKMSSQQHSWSIKLALGARTWDLVRPILLESWVVSMAGALLGLVIAYWASPLMLQMAWTGLVKTPLSATPDLRVIAFTAGLTLLTTLLFAIVPAGYATRTEAAAGLRRSTRTVHAGSSRLGKLLLTGQVALSLVLVTGALLFAKTLVSLHTVETGYQRDHLLTLQLFPEPGAANLTNHNAYYRDLAEKIRSLPGVAFASYSNGAPENEYEYRLPMSVSPESNPVQAIDEVVGPEFFTTLNMHVLAGREFTWSDDEHSQPVAIISKNLAEKLYGSENPMGRDVYWGVRSNQKKLRIVGVVNNASLWKVESVEPLAVYRALLQQPDYNEPLLDIRTRVEPASLKTVAERTLRSLGQHYSLRTATIEERLDSFTTAQRLTALLAGFFGVIALLIAAVGLYALMSFHVTQRTT